MTKKEKLNKILDKLNSAPKHYFERSLYIDQNEMRKICENLIENNVKNVIEIGTYKGVSAAVFASVIEGNVYTINISQEEIDLSKKLWEDLGIKNIIQYKGSSLDVLPNIVKSVDDVNFVYVDGNHDVPYPSKEFEIISNSKIKNNNCLVYFDDGPLLGVMEAIEKFDLIKLKNYDWMFKDEKNKNGSGTLRAYTTFGEVKLNWK